MPHCYYCNSNFLNFENLKIHSLVTHRFTASRPIKCGEPNCFRGFSKMKLYEKHFSQVHGNHGGEPVINPNMDVNPNNEIADDPGQDPDPAQPEQAANELLGIANNFDLRSFIANRSSLFFSRLYCHPTIPQNAIQMIQEESQAFASASMSVLKIQVNKALLREGGPTGEDILEVNRSFSILEKPFDDLDFTTDYKRIKVFTRLGIYIPSEPITIGQARARRRVKGIYREKFVDITAQLVPLRDTLKLLLQYENILNETLQHMQNLSAEENILCDVIQGSHWKTLIETLRVTRNNDVFLPLFIYNDEYETCNPLGTHRGRHKLSAVYVSIPCLPLRIQSCLNSVLLCFLFNAKDRKTFGNLATFTEVIDELNFLHDTGILVQVGGEVKQIFFVVAQFVADNLGFNQNLGLVESFVANHPCRICRMPLNLIRTSCKDDPNVYRNPTNYAEDLQENDATATGIKDECIWNKVAGFHATTHTSMDIMHDVLLSTAGLDIIFVLNSLQDAKFFTYEELCMKVADFDYGTDCTNKPPDFANVFIGDSLSLTAAEMMVVIRYLPLIMGEFVPRDNIIWELLLQLRECVDLIFAPHMPKECAELLRVLVEEHHELYMRLTKCHLTFKQHMMTHYHFLFLKFGPPRRSWCMTFERGHSTDKKAAAALICRKNTPLSVAKKHQLRLAHFFHSSSLFHDACESGPSMPVVKLNIEQQYNTSLQALLDPCLETSWVKLYGILCKPSMMLFHDFQEEEPCFVRVTKLLMSAGTPYFLCCKYQTISYDRHYCAYHVMKCDSFVIVNQSQLFDPLPLSRSQVKEQFYVTLRYKP